VGNAPSGALLDFKLGVYAVGVFAVIGVTGDGHFPHANSADNTVGVGFVCRCGVPGVAHGEEFGDGEVVAIVIVEGII
ncbi:hypothetical protein NL349_29810, partial [Klebsiella pneumoniae]|nr:hypothetical protein [Klebsiella pneumoniae]